MEAPMESAAILQRRMDMSAHNDMSIWHWGYGYETVPCVGTEGYCLYMWMYWKMHDLNMKYSFIVWYVITGVVLAVGLVRWLLFRKSGSAGHRDVESTQQKPAGTFSRGVRALTAATRRRLLPQGTFGLFPRISRAQVVILAMICIYLTIFSFIGGIYNITVHDKTKTRTPLGWWSNRVGVLAFALTPLSLILSMRENLFSLITGIPYQHFNFLHRWLGRIIFVQSLLHTIGWTVVQGHLYEPETQPHYLKVQWKERYYYMGVLAQLAIAFVFVQSLTPVIRRTGYEAFRKMHYAGGLLYVGFCIGHWPEIKEWMVASLCIFFFDRFCRLARLLLIHFNLKSSDKGFGLKAAESTLELHTDGDGVEVVIMRFVHRHRAWISGQHFYLTFPTISLWQAHPFTPASSPSYSDTQSHLYILVGMGGETKRLVQAAQAEKAAALPVLLTGPFGMPVIDPGSSNYLLISGGSGVSFTLPLAEQLLKRPGGTVEFVWVIRRVDNARWITGELESLIEKPEKSKVHLKLSIYVSRDAAGESGVSTPKDIEKGEMIATTKVAAELLDSRLQKYMVYSRPNLGEVVASFCEGTAGTGRGQVLASGPDSMNKDCRQAVAEMNDGGRVWRGSAGEGDLGLYIDSRYY